MCKRIARIHGAVAQKLESGTVQRVRARTRDHAHLPARSFTVFGGVGICEHIEFAYRIDSQEITAGSSRGDGQLAGSGVLDPVEQKQILAGPPARYRKRVPVAGARLRAFHGAVVDRAWVQGNQVVEAAAVERQILYFALAHQP